MIKGGPGQKGGAGQAFHFAFRPVVCFNCNGEAAIEEGK